MFTGRFKHPPTEVLFDAICRRDGIEYLLTAPRSPTTTGKIERSHRTMRAKLLSGTLFAHMASAQREVDACVEHYYRDRTHQSLAMATPAARFTTATRREPVTVPGRSGPDWVARKVATGVVCVPGQQVSVGVHRAGERCDVLVGPDSLQFWIGNELLRTVARTSTGPVRNKRVLGGSLTRTAAKTEPERQASPERETSSIRRSRTGAIAAREAAAARQDASRRVPGHARRMTGRFLEPSAPRPPAARA